VWVAKIGQWLAGTLAGLVEVLKAQTRETHERLVIDEVVTGRWTPSHRDGNRSISDIPT
jgi:hypothetical protein